jgi:ubiquinone biosynthesis accessory factor UbiJ
MATQSPFSWAAQALPKLAAQTAKHLSTSFHPPEWVVDETVNRLVLFLNHVLMGEPEAMARLARQKGQRIELIWERVHLQLTPTAAGLFERGQFEGFDLRLRVNEESALSLASALARGDKPKVHIEGDVQLAAEINWLIDHVRWDAEEDLARLMGDAPAHTLAQAARQALAALRSFVAKRPGSELRTGGAA